MQTHFVQSAQGELPEPVISLFTIFNKIKNDQMLLEEDYQHIVKFREYLKTSTEIDPETIFTISETQETKHTPYIFQETIQTIGGFIGDYGL